MPILSAVLNWLFIVVITGFQNENQKSRNGAYINDLSPCAKKAEVVGISANAE
jgi:hypothetical protein